MDRERKIRILENIASRALIFLGCFGIALILANAGFALAEHMQAVNQPAENALGAFCLLMSHSQTILIFGTLIAIGSRQPIWQYALFGFFIAILPPLFIDWLREPLGPAYILAVGCLNAFLAGGMRYALVKLLDALVDRPTAK